MPATAFQNYLKTSQEVIAAVAETLPEARMEKAIELCVLALRAGKPILTCGNGGSAADAMHISAELVGRFLKERKGLKCICLSDNTATITAWANDYEYSSIFSRQVEAFGEQGGVLIGLSTSGNSPNVLNAVQKARDIGMSVIGFTGQKGGRMGMYCDALLDVPSRSTPLIQQAHICLYHYLCEQIEARMAA